MRAIRNGVIVAVILFLTFSVILVVTHEGRVAIATALLLPEVLPGATSHPVNTITSAPLVEQLEYPLPGGTATARLYRPNDRNRHGAIILFLGISPDMNDATLARLAEAMAREGVVVLIPEAQGLLQGRITYEAVDQLVAAFQFLRDQDYVDPKRVGYGGFCVGSSLALIAAGDPRISAQVRFVNFFGGYYSARSLLQVMTTHTLDADSVDQAWEPNQDAWRWMVEQLASAVPDEREQQQIEQLALELNTPAPSERDVSFLSPRAQSIYRLLANRDPLRFPELFAELPVDMREEMEQLSPSSHLGWLQAKVYIMADRGDTYLPYREALRLRAALEDYPKKLYMEFDLFRHMLPERELPPWQFAVQAVKLWYQLYLVMLEIA